MDDTDFTGKTILVVGGSSGIGNGIAQAFRARGGVADDIFDARTDGALKIVLVPYFPAIASPCFAYARASCS
jgi:NAD(P)-dependent dehydrogenase (short-subunit alcohol dehydrogenase family)